MLRMKKRWKTSITTQQRLIARARRPVHRALLGRLEGEPVMRFTHRICTGVIGSVMPSSGATTMVMASPALVGRVKLMPFLMLS